MPFTFCHPAAVLIFNYLPKKWISLTGLIAGSIIPDFEYFIRMQKLSLYSHSLSGLLWFNLPAGVLLTFIYYGIVHKTLITHLPTALKRRVFRYSGFDWVEHFKRKWLVIFVSILFGAISHLLWDHFTFETVHFLNNRLPSGKDIPYYLFWSFNSLIGGVIIAFALYQIPAGNKQKSARLIALFWIMVVGTTVFIFVLRAFSAGLMSIRDYIVSFVTATILGFILTALVFKYTSRHHTTDRN